MTTRIDAVCRTARHQDGSEPRSGVGVAPSITEPGFIALSPSWPQYTYLELRALPTAVPCARLHTRLVLREWGLDNLAEIAELLASELLTNAYKTTVEQRLAAPIRLRLSRNHNHVLIEVWDADPIPPQPHTGNKLPSADAESGRGLLLVATLSERWNWYTVPGWGGKVVWAEVGS
jgi:anti-sigma regulatory factor (Ser/Thr protein kinase)